MNAPIVDPLRACAACRSHINTAAGLACTDPIVRGPYAQVPCAGARERHGGCGWDARRLHWPAIGAVPEPAITETR